MLPPSPPIDTPLQLSALPTPTPLTLDPEDASRPVKVLLTAVLVALLPYTTIAVVMLPRPPMDTWLAPLTQPIPTPLAVDPEWALRSSVDALIAVLVALLLFPTTIVAMVLPPLPSPIVTGLYESAKPIPTPLTLDPEWALPLGCALLTAVLMALLMYPTAIVAMVVPKPPIDTGLEEYAKPIARPLTLDPAWAL